MKLLTDWFDRVFVINCVHRPDRLALVKEELACSGVADLAKIKFYPAIIGDWTSIPDDWKSGRGAWGCLRSHQRILEDLLHDRNEDEELSWKSALIMEDDVFFMDDALERLQEFMQEVPAEWGQLYLGGQHQLAPTLTDRNNVLVGNSVNRTHAYAVSSDYIQRIYKHVSYASDYRDTNKHIDHQLELAHRRRDWPVYCPAKWLCGQEAGSSNISGRINERTVWEL